MSKLPTGCEFCDDCRSLVIQGKCHPTAPIRVKIEGLQIILTCYLPDCEREIARFTLSEVQE